MARANSVPEWRLQYDIDFESVVRGHHITADVCQPWTDVCNQYSEYLIIRSDYLIIPFDYLIIE